MKKSLLFLFVAIFVCVPAFADITDKFSASTQIFLSERDGVTKLPKIKSKEPLIVSNDTLQALIDETLVKETKRRPIAPVEEYNGQKMISAFVRVNDRNFSAVESLGAVMQKNFGDLATMLLPIDKVEAIAQLGNVTYIEVSEVLEPLNDRQRTVTQAIDAIANTDAAKALGITGEYTGKGVILGVIDTGIDFQHIAFKDKSGNTRIKRAYKLSGSNSTTLTTYSSSSQINALTYDTNDGDHGTHTVSTAGGSSVVVNGSTVTVTDDHVNATYGGMAPEADLVIAGLSSLYTASIATAIGNICDYADSQGKPCVISLSLGSQVGAHDGTGTVASVVNQYAGNNHIIVYAASNDGMRAQAFVDMGVSNGGGMYASGTSTSSKPMIANVQRSFSNADGNVEMLMPTICAYARTAGVATSLKFHVVNVKTGEIVYSSSAYTSSTTIDVTGSTGLAQYFKSSSQYSNAYGDAGKIRLVRSQDANNNKYYWMIYAPIMLSTSYAANSNGVYVSDYAFCVSVYPTSTASSTIIDMWENSYCWFGQDLNLSSSSYNYVKGNDECSVSDNACYDKVISVGAYVTRNSVTNYAGTTTDASDSYPNIGDHAYFSSWQTQGYGPTGTALPHINAPGARIIAGVNHYHTTSVDDYSYYGDDYKSDLIVNSTSYPYAAMEGTSMATPCVSGIVAQWLQACVEAGKTPTPDYIKEVMQNTWDTDQWTNGTGGGHGAKTFGTHGKINAIKGIQYILGTSSGPVLKASPESLAFDATYVGDESPKKTFTLTGVNLKGNVTLALTDPSGVFAIDKTSVTQANATAGQTITVTFTPKAAASYTGYITISSTGAESITVNLGGTGQVHTPVLATDKSSLTYTGYTSQSYNQTVTVTGTYLQGNITTAISGANATMFSVSPSTLSNSGTLTVTYSPTSAGTHTATLTISSQGAASKTVTLNGTAEGPGISATPTSVSFNGYTGQTYTQVITVKGNNFSGNVTATLTGANGIYSIDKTTIANATALQGTTITVTYKPTERGTTNATLTLKSNGVEDVVIPITGTAQGGTITATPTTVNFSGYATRVYTQTVTIGSSNLEEDITATLSDANGVYTLDKTSFTKNQNGTLTITWAPLTAGNTTATVTLSSRNADDVTINLSGTAQAATPTLIVSPTSLTMSGELNETKTQTFTVAGRFIGSDVTLTLTDANGVFRVTPTTIPAANISEDSPVTVTVTFVSATEGTFTGKVDVTATGAATQTVTLNGEASDGGTASDAYLDIAKYKTIDDAGWSTSYVTNLYKYTEYEDNEVAWLTLPVYGAWSSIYYNPKAQKWIQSSLTTSNAYAGKTWTYTNTYTNPYMGSSAYFGSNTTARVMGYNSRNNTTQKAVSFFVTNTTAVKALGIGASGASSTYPAAIKVYECTKNADGTLTAATTATKSATSTSTSTTNTINLSITGLDETKIYKVEASVYRGYIYEIGFQTPLNKPSLKADPAELTMRAAPGEQATASFTVKGKLLSDNVSVALTDNSGVFAVDKQNISISEAQNTSTVTVTFSPADEGTYTGTVNLTSGSLTATVNLTGTCSDGGTASDAYLNIAKYATIDDAGWDASKVDVLYQYTEYPEDQVAWLTLPSYGAYAGNGYQKWLSFANSYYRVSNASWEADDIFLGNDVYFTNATVYAYGRYNNTNTTAQISNFFVTNCTAVKTIGSTYGATTSYPMTLAAYECTEDADGNLTASTSAYKSATFSTEEDDFTLVLSELDANKIYKIVASGARGYFQEIGFQTPLPFRTLYDVANSDDVKVGKTYYIYDNDLTAIYVSGDGKTLYCKDDNKYITQYAPNDDQTDYMHGRTDLQKDDWDQSNWVALTTEDGEFSASLIGYQLKGVKGVVTDKTNPVIALTAMPTADQTVAKSEYPQNLNNFLATNFDPEYLTDDNLYFFVPAKPMEVANVMWAQWVESEGKFIVPSKIDWHSKVVDGEFFANFSLYNGDMPELEDGAVYNFIGLAKVEKSTATTLKTASAKAVGEKIADTGYTVYPLDGFVSVGKVDGGTVTSIYKLYGEYGEIVDMKYVNPAGLTSDKPFKGVNIIVITYSDGTRRTVKHLAK